MVHVFQTREQLQRQLAAMLTMYFKTHPQAQVALSGGSTPIPVYEALGHRYAAGVDWSGIHFYWGDERCVSPDHPDSNFYQANQAWLAPAGIPDTNIHRICGEADPEAEARRYDSLLRQRLPVKDGVPVFDMILLGMGEDGHTASIFPDQMDLLNDTRAVAVAEHPSTGQQRITLTGPVLRAARLVIFVVTGRSKAQPLEAIVSHTTDSQAYPAAHIRPTPETEVQWWVDVAAFPSGKKQTTT